MQDTLSRYLGSLSNHIDKVYFKNILEPIVDLMSCQSMISAAIVPSTGAVTTKIGAVDWYGMVKGVPVKIAAATVMPALVGTISTNTFNVYAFFVDTAGVVTSAMGTEGATLAAMKFPTRPAGKTFVGASMFNPTAAPFVGGTTLADAANTNHIGLNALGGYDATSLVG